MEWCMRSQRVQMAQSTSVDSSEKLAAQMKSLVRFENSVFVSFICQILFCLEPFFLWWFHKITEIGWNNMSEQRTKTIETSLDPLHSQPSLMKRAHVKGYHWLWVMRVMRESRAKMAVIDVLLCATHWWLWHTFVRKWLSRVVILAFSFVDLLT